MREPLRWEKLTNRLRNKREEERETGSGGQRWSNIGCSFVFLMEQLRKLRHRKLK